MTPDPMTPDPMKKTMLEEEHFYYEMLDKVERFLRDRRVNMDHPVCQEVLENVLAPYGAGSLKYWLRSCEFAAGHVYGLLEHYAELGKYRGKVFTKEDLSDSPYKRLVQRLAERSLERSDSL